MYILLDSILNVAQKRSRIVLLLHHQADPDAIGAATALYEFFKNKGKECIIIADGVNQSGKKMIEMLDIDVFDTYTAQNNDLIILLDIANRIQLGKFIDIIPNDSLISIDHHVTNEIRTFCKINILDTSIGSTCLLIANLLNEYIFSPRSSTALICGHLYDSRRFLYNTDQQTFIIMNRLIEQGGNYNLANEILQNIPTLGEKIAHLKAFQRLRYRKLHQLIVAVSHVGAYEASTARSLLSAGSDIVLIISVRNDLIRGSARVNYNVNINIGKIMEQLSTKYNGSGGGHEQAAGFNIPNTINSEVIINEFFNIVERELQKISNKK